MFKKLFNWLTRDSEYDIRLKECSLKRASFIKSLDERQLAYYYSLEESLPRAITLLESRILDLEKQNVCKNCAKCK